MGYFKVGDLSIYYEELGNPDGTETIAFMNGVMASVSSWSLLWPVFEKMNYRIILHDFKGQLKSDKPEGVYSFAEHASEAKALYESLGVDKVHLIGTSYGGETAMKFAIMFPDMVKTVSIIDSVSELDAVLEGFVQCWKTLCDTGDGEAFFWGMAPSIYGPSFIEANKEMLSKRAAATKKAERSYFDGQKRLYDTFVSDVYMTDELGKIRCPAMVICGEEDILKKPEFSKIIADNIPNAEYVLLPDCGHVAIFEKPEVLSSILLGFIVKNSL